MDIDAQSHLGETTQSSSCALCHRTFSSDYDAGDLEAIGVCGDCKFLLLEDSETASPDVYHRRRRVSRRRYDSSESMESMFSQQFSQIVSLARQNASNVFERDGYSVDGDDASARLVQRASSRSGSRRWRRVLSDTESEGFDSLYGESESNASFRRFRAFHGEADTVSYSAYGGGESDVSLDGQSLLGNDNFGHTNGGSEPDSDNDSDIDPMNAGIFQWNSEDEDDTEWDEAEIEPAPQPSHGSLMSNGTNWRGQLLSPEIVATFPLDVRDDLLNSLEESLQRHYPGHSREYFEARGFGDLLEHLVGNNSSRRGAPPASVSYVNHLPRLTVNEEMDCTACAVCKDSFSVGIVVNRLPCTHLYHPSCILPWLSARNTCPLCRYELPTDDRDYEARKRNEMLHHIHRQPELTEDDEAQREVVVVGEDGVVPQNVVVPRNRWFSLAAPIVSIVGISLILWFGNSSAAGRMCPSGRRRENKQRRWWSFF